MSNRLRIEPQVNFRKNFSFLAERSPQVQGKNYEQILRPPTERIEQNFNGNCKLWANEQSGIASLNYWIVKL